MAATYERIYRTPPVLPNLKKALGFSWTPEGSESHMWSTLSYSYPSAYFLGFEVVLGIPLFQACNCAHFIVSLLGLIFSAHTL